jgi:hypothetical protein
MPDEPPRDGFDDMVSRLKAEKTKKPDLKLVLPTPISMPELERFDAADPVMVVPGLFVEGLTLLAGKPKVGKSWLMLHTGLMVAQAGLALGTLACAAGEVLYCALEDTPRRLQRRTAKLDVGWPARMSVLTTMPRLAAGGLQVIKNWIASVADPRLVMIDTLELVRDRKANENGYAADYSAVLELRELANRHHLAIVLVHHLRKAEAEDPFDTVSGTLGLTGAPDAILVLTGQAGLYTLRGRGRDLEEFAKPISFDRVTCLWQLNPAGPTAKASDWDNRKTLTLLRRILVQMVDQAGTDMRPFIGGPQVRAVDMELVRAEFYKTYPVTDEAPDKTKADTRQRAFRRAVDTAVNAALIVCREIDGKQLLWFAT